MYHRCCVSAWCLAHVDRDVRFEAASRQRTSRNESSAGHAQPQCFNHIKLQRQLEVSAKLIMRPVWKYKAEARRQQQQRNNHDNSSLNAVLVAAREGKLGVCFSGAAFGASYQLGAAQILQELGLLGADTPVAGLLLYSAAGSYGQSAACCDRERHAAHIQSVQRTAIQGLSQTRP